MSEFNDIEFVGDSMLLRFLKTVWHQKTFIDEQKKERLGISVSGQNVKKALRKVNRLTKCNNLPLKRKVIIMLGTNDILDKKKEAPESIITNLEHVVRSLAVNADTVYLLTLPPIPRSDDDQAKRLNIYNTLLKKMGKRIKTVQVLDVNSLFVNANGSVKAYFFETHMGQGKRRRPDGIHWNAEGIMAFHQFLSEKGIY